MIIDISQLATQLGQGSRIALSRSITLLESTRADHREMAEELLVKLLPKSGGAIRIAISGPPGVGKSSFIESFGLYVLHQGKKLAVLAIDPSSPITGGSILGDKARMEELSKSERCFIRPSPSSGVLGGVARHTRETLLLCEAAGYDVVLIETVGIGQSEIMAASMTDLFVQLHQPFSGDELQGIKKGVMELADLVIVTKADGDSLLAAEVAKNDLLRAISLTRTVQGEIPEVLLTSAHQRQGMDTVWTAICSMIDHRKATGQLSQKRKEQVRQWLDQELVSELKALLESHPRFSEALKSTLRRVEESGEHCGRAAKALIRTLLTLSKN
jgi:LAO/AO transport system kinase